MGKIIRFNKRASEAVAKPGASPVKCHVAAFAADAEGDYVFVNGHWSRLAGVSQASALEQGWLASVHPDERTEVARAWESAVRGERYFGLAYRLRGGAAETRRVLNQAIPQHNDDGELVGYGGTIIDLAQFSTVGPDLSTDARLRHILDLLALGYYEHDLVTDKVSCSPNCLELIGDVRTLQEFDALIHPEDLLEVNSLFDRSIKEGTLFAAEYRIAARDKDWNRIRDYAKIIYAANGMPCRSTG